MMNRCMEMMGSMMGGGVIGGVVVFAALLALLVFFAGVTALGAVGVWGYRRLAR